MAKKKYKVVHYLNQFYAGIGGEEKANIPPLIKEGVVGLGKPLQQALGEDWEIVATVICGDSYFAENIEAAIESLVESVVPYKPDVFVAGPAFNAGRYGIACGASCAAISKKLGVPVVTAMYEENPALELYRKGVYILPTTKSVLGMKEIIPKMASFAQKLGLRQEVGSPGVYDKFMGNIIYPQALSSQKFSHRLLKIQQRKAIILFAPRTVQCIPDCLSR